MNNSTRNAIRAHYPQYVLQFRSDGRVWARRKADTAWGVLYTKSQLARHVAELATIKARGLAK